MTAQNETVVRSGHSTVGPAVPTRRSEPVARNDSPTERADPPQRGKSLMIRFIDSLMAALSPWNV
jgi:hypothetical protein